LKKSKAASKKTVKTCKAKKPASSKKAPKKAPVKMPVNTFDAWIAKQIKAGKKEIPPETIVRSEDPAVLPKDTYEIWLEKQKPKEAPQQKQGPHAPDTFEVWMSKQVATRGLSAEASETPAASAVE
jgi:hypothetical protein